MTCSSSRPPTARFWRDALTHRALAGVAFTGSTATAATINRTLAGREGPIVPLIAETGGVNAMIVDSTALPEQVVDDVIASAFTSAGQRCSALRVLYLQEEIADRVIEMLIGAMKCLTIGDPADPATDVGPVISAADAQQRLEQARGADDARGKTALRVSIDAIASRAATSSARGCSSSSSPDQQKTEEFGPILHVFRYRAEQLGPGVGCGPLHGIRPDTRECTAGWRAWRSTPSGRFPVGNTYINRNMIGAVVGVQPFGGQGLSGTGPRGGRAELPAALRHRADPDHQYRCDRRRGRAAVLRPEEPRSAPGRS